MPNLEFAGVRHVGRPQSLGRLSVSPVPGPGPPVARGTKTSLIATRTVNVSVLTDINILRPDALLAGGAGGAFLMINSAPGSFNALVVENLAATARAAGILVLLLISHDGGRVQKLESVAARHVAPLGGDAVQLGVAVPAGDLHIRSVARQEGVQRPTVSKVKLERFEAELFAFLLPAVPAGETLLVVIIMLAGHLLCWEHHPGTPRTGLLSVLPSDSVGGNIGLVIELGLRGATESLVANPAKLLSSL